MSDSSGKRWITSEDITGLILAGGHSQAFVHVAGKPMIEHVYDAIRPLVHTVYISRGTHPETLPWPTPSFPDQIPETGPLGGIYSGFQQTSTPWLLVTACDMPFLTPTALQQLLRLSSTPAQAHVAVDTHQRRHPLCACYHRSCLSFIEKALHNQSYALQKLLQQLPTVRWVPQI